MVLDLLNTLREFSAVVQPACALRHSTCSHLLCCPLARAECGRHGAATAAARCAYGLGRDRMSRAARTQNSKAEERTVLGGRVRHRLWPAWHGQRAVDRDKGLPYYAAGRKR